MTSFGWKKKTGDKVNKIKRTAFEEQSKDEILNDNEVVDWLTLAPKRTKIQLEDAMSKSQRLKQEGEVLAESERFWEALKKWEEAIQLTPDSAVLYELKAQAYISLNEVYPAITAASKAVELAPTWWVAHQTLGRAHLNLGEVRMALVSFSKALHLNPACEELRTDDLQWAHTLVQRKNTLSTEQKSSEELSSVEITEIKDEDHCKSLVTVKGKQGCLDTNLLHLSEKKSQQKTVDLKTLPANYVFMRD